MLFSQRAKSYLLLLILLVYSTSTITEDYKEDESNVEISLTEGELKEVKVNSNQTLTITGSLVNYLIGDGLTLSIFYHERDFSTSTKCYTTDKESKETEFICKDDYIVQGSEYYNYIFIREKEENVGFKAEVSIVLFENQTITVLASIPKPVDMKYDFKDFTRFTYKDVTKYMPLILKLQIPSNETEHLKKNLLFLQNDYGFFYYTNETFGNVTMDSHLKAIESNNIDKVEHYFKILYKEHKSKIDENITVDFTIEQSDIEFEYIRDSKRPMKTYNYDIKDKNQTYTIIYDYNFLDLYNYDFIEYFKGDCVVRRKAIFNDSSATTLFPNENDTLSKSQIFFDAVSSIGAEIHQVLCENSGEIRLNTLHPENDKTLEIGSEDIFVIIDTIKVGIAETTKESENITLLLIAASNETINASFSISGVEEEKIVEGTLEVQFTFLKDKENSIKLISTKPVALFIKVVPQWGVQEIVKPTMSVGTNAIFVPLNKPNKVYTKVSVKITGVKEDLTYQMNHQMHNHTILPVKKNLDIATTIKKEQISKETFTITVNNPYLEKDINEDYKYYLTFYTEKEKFTNVYVNYTDINRDNYSLLIPGEIKIISNMEKANTSKSIYEEYLTEFGEEEGNMVIFYKTCGGKTDIVTERLLGDNVEQRLINEEVSTNYTALTLPNYNAEILLSAQYKSEKVPYYGLTLSYKYLKTGEQIDTETFTKLNDKEFNIKYDSDKSIISWDTYEEAKGYNFVYEFYLLKKTESDEKYINNECFLEIKKEEYQKEMIEEENDNSSVIVIKNITEASYHYDTPGTYLVNVLAYSKDVSDTKLPFRFIYKGISIKVEEKIGEITLKEGEVREFNSSIGSEIKFKADLSKYKLNDENIIKIITDEVNDTICTCKVVGNNQDDNETNCKLIPSKEPNELKFLFRKSENSTTVQLHVALKGNDTFKFKIGLNNLRKIDLLEFKDPFVEIKANNFFDELLLVSNLPKEQEKNTYLLFFKEQLDIHINGLYDTEKTLNQRMLVLDKNFRDKLNISNTTSNIMIVVKQNENDTRKLLVEKTEQEIIYAYNRNELNKIIINEKAEKEINRIMYIVADYTGKKDSKYLNLYETISNKPNIKYKTKNQIETSEKILPDQSSTSPEKEFFEDPCFETECIQLVMINIQVPQGKHLYFKYHIVNDTANEGEIIPIDSKESIFNLVKGKDKSYNLSEQYDHKKINLLFETEFDNEISIRVNSKEYVIGKSFKSLTIKVEINDTLIELKLTSGETSFIIIKLEYSDVYETINRSTKKLKQHKILMPLFKVNQGATDYTDLEINIFNIDVKKFIFYIDADITNEPILDSDDSKWKGLYKTEGESIEHGIKLNLTNPYKEYDVDTKYHAFAALSFYEEKQEEDKDLPEYIISINYINKNDKDPEINLEETEYATEGGKFFDKQNSGKLIKNEDFNKTMFVIYNLCGTKDKSIRFKTFEKSIETKEVEKGPKTIVESIENYYEDVKVTFTYEYKSNHLEGYTFSYLYTDNSSDLPLDEIKKGNEDKLKVSYDKDKKIISWDKLEENSNVENYLLLLVKVDNEEESSNINNLCYLHYLLNEKQDHVANITLEKGTSEFKYSEEYEKGGYNHAVIVANIKYGGKLVYNNAEIKKPDKKKKSNTGLIVGIIFGVIALMIILIFVYNYCKKKRKVVMTEIENAKPLSEDFDVGVAKD